ncbi:hypothetical protein FXO38_31076 [Capsicum annuum]|nr:hypothetical protein FXO38_31076 [Capsicum annuum]
MDLPESKYDHWKAKFIDGLPPLFAERVRKSLRGSYGEVQYLEKTYGQLIVACTQEGLSLYNELKLARQIKLDKLREKSQLGDFCEQFGMDKPVARKTKRYSKSDKSYRKKRSRYRTKEERKTRKFYPQFEDLDLNIQTLTGDNVLELLKEVTVEKLREKIINFVTQKPSTNTASISKDNSYDNYHMSYSLDEVNRCFALSQNPGRDTTFDDLKIEVEKLKKKIVFSKEKQMISDHRILQIEEKISDIPENIILFTSKGKEKDFENSEDSEINKLSPKEDLKRDYFLGMMQLVTAHKWYINCTILINMEFSITNIAMIDSGADVSCIQEAWIHPGKQPEDMAKKDEIKTLHITEDEQTLLILVIEIILHIALQVLIFRSGGRCLSIEYTDKVGELSKKYGLKLQIDSAHIFNASVALELPVHRLVQAADSVLRSLQGVYEVRDCLVDNKEVTCPCIDIYCDVV